MIQRSLKHQFANAIILPEHQVPQKTLLSAILGLFLLGQSDFFLFCIRFHYAHLFTCGKGTSHL